MTEDELLTAIENTMQAAHRQCQPYFLQLAKLWLPDVHVVRTQIYLSGPQLARVLVVKTKQTVP